MTAYRFILASASPRRLQLLQHIGVVPDDVIAADVDETPLKGELPDKYALRCAKSKAEAIAARYPNAIVLGADTVVACGRRILPKAEDEETARYCLKILSGRRHRVYTGVCVYVPPPLGGRLGGGHSVTLKQASPHPNPPPAGRNKVSSS